MAEADTDHRRNGNQRRAQQDVGQGVQAPLHRCLGYLGRRHQIGDMPHLGRHPGRGDNADTVAVGDDGAHERHIELVADDDLAAVERLGLLFDRLRLAGQGRLVDPQLIGLHQPHVGGHDIADIQTQNIPRHDVCCRDTVPLPVALHHGVGRPHLLERIQGLLRLDLLHEADGRVEEDQEGDGDAVHQVPGVQRQGRAEQQDDQQRILELTQKQQQRGHLGRLGQCIGSVLAQALTRLVAVQPAIGIGLQGVDDIG